MATQTSDPPPDDAHSSGTPINTIKSVVEIVLATMAIIGGIVSAIYTLDPALLRLVATGLAVLVLVLIVAMTVLYRQTKR